MSEWLAVVVIAWLATTLHTAIGFGVALVAVPGFVWAGRTLPEAVALVFGLATVQTALGTMAVRRHIDWRQTLEFAAIQWATVPIGVYAMERLVAFGTTSIKQVVGVVVIVLVTARLRVAPRDTVHRGWGWAAAAITGVLGGLVGMGGAVVALFALAHTWGKERIRAFLWPQFFLVLPVLAGCLIWRLGLELWKPYALGIALAPVTWTSVRAGLLMTRRWQGYQVQRVAIVVLYAIGVASVLGPHLSR